MLGVGMTGLSLFSRDLASTLIDQEGADPLTRPSHALIPAHRPERVKPTISKPTRDTKQASPALRAWQQIGAECIAGHAQRLRPASASAYLIPTPRKGRHYLPMSIRVTAPREHAAAHARLAPAQSVVPGPWRESR